MAKTIYDPACGTGGMLSVAEEYLHSLNASTELVSFGQEINDQTFAICKADMLIKGNNADYIKDGNTLSDDQFAGSTFDYILSNPPFGREWKNEKAKVEEEAKLGFGGRFGAGLPATSDGQMLFLMTAISKMKDKVIYICSNQNIANQNIRKLDVTGKNAIGSVSDTRLSMQHLKITEQENDPQIKEGFIQLIPLTPETSFRMTTGGGSVQERALMYAILRRMPDFKGHVTSLEKFMIMDAVKAWDGWAKWNFENRVAECEKMTKGVYPQNVIEKILNYQEYESIRDMLLNHLHERRYNKQLTYSNYYVMNKLRVMFARISVSMLEPDLVIMDEFQRFKFLLSSDDSELGILAHSFLSGHDTRVLLLSATPYKLYSTLEEIDENQLDEHYAEFFQVMNFLFDDEVKDIKFKEVWKNYSHALSELKAGDSAIIRMKELAENAMYQGVSRTERISVICQ